MTLTLPLPYGVRGNPNARILIVGEGFTSGDEKVGEAFRTHQSALEALLNEAGINPNDCLYTNICNAMPPYGDPVRWFITEAENKTLQSIRIRGLLPDTLLLEGLLRLDTLIRELNPAIIVGLGPYALWALTTNSFSVGNGSKRQQGWKVPGGLGNYRGSQLDYLDTDIPVMCTYSPGAIASVYSWRYQAVHDLRTRVPRALAGKVSWVEPQRDYIVAPSYETCCKCLMELLMRATLASGPILLTADIETINYTCECIGLGWSKTAAICIPILKSVAPGGMYTHTNYWSAEEEVGVAQLLKKVLEHPNIWVAGQNFIYDMQYLFQDFGIMSNYKHDTMLAQHTLFPGQPMGLNFISSMWCNFHRYWKEDGKDASATLDDNKRWTYNCRDCVVTYEALEVQWEALNYFNLQLQYAIQMARANASTRMSLRGMRVDHKRRAEESVIQLETTMEYANKFTGLLPASIHTPNPKTSPWWTSPTQQAHIFYESIGIEPVIDKDTGNYTTNNDALSKIAAREPALTYLTRLLKEYRSIEASGQFITARLDRDKRLRSSFSPTAETFRYRSGETAKGTGRNVQNIPSGSED